MANNKDNTILWVLLTVTGIGGVGFLAYKLLKKEPDYIINGEIATPEQKQQIQGAIKAGKMTISSINGKPVIKANQEINLGHGITIPAGTSLPEVATTLQSLFKLTKAPTNLQSIVNNIPVIDYFRADAIWWKLDKQNKQVLNIDKDEMFTLEWSVRGADKIVINRDTTPIHTTTQAEGSIKIKATPENATYSIIASKNNQVAKTTYTVKTS